MYSEAQRACCWLGAGNTGTKLLLKSLNVPKPTTSNIRPLDLAAIAYHPEQEEELTDYITEGDVSAASHDHALQKLVGNQ